MVSFAFLLCGTLFLSGAIALPYPGESDEATTIATTDIDVTTTVKPNQTLAEEITQQASQAGIKVLIDVVDGKDLHASILDRSIEALHKVRGEIASVGHSILKRYREWRNGVPISTVFGNVWRAIYRKFTGKNKSFDDIIAAVGVDNVTKFVESATNIIKGLIAPSINNGTEPKTIEPKAMEGVNEEDMAQLIESAEEVKEKTE